ncbi:MAG: YceI family protein [Deltaproteobacteria bacterium]|nr:YceI family protein [Deltaproteobacteria bacterium]
MRCFKIRTVLFAFLLLFVSSGAYANENYQVDKAHSTIGFSVTHKMISNVRGNFTDFSASLNIDPKSNQIADINAAIKAASINTNLEKRDGHLRSADFFDVDKFPEITFKSSKITSLGEKKYRVDGELTMKGIKKSISLEGKLKGIIKDSYQGKNMKVAGFEASGKINRKDFGIIWNKILDHGGVAVGDEVEILLDIEAVHFEGK